ncbi:MAG: hypothetical protein P1U89_20175 [Verrucomicrobiales bacterium]|nr:hypothetical protein [Verrucomicrobiales bacterium]
MKRSTIGYLIATLLLIVNSGSGAEPEGGARETFIAETLPGHLIDDLNFTKPGHCRFTMRGWTIFLNDKLVGMETDLTLTMLPILDQQLKRVVEALPERALAEVRKVPIWINPTYPGQRGKAEYHPNVEWLVNNHRDPEMGRAIEISNVRIFAFENRRMPYLLLHELSHAYHDRVLAEGYRNPELRATFKRAEKSGSYNEVARFDGNRTTTDRAYAMSNPMEYFAESSEAYFGKNDFFPFNRAELLSHDPEMHDLVKKLWGVDEKE